MRHRAIRGRLVVRGRFVLRGRLVAFTGLLGTTLTALTVLPAQSALAGPPAEISLSKAGGVPEALVDGLARGPKGTVWFAENAGGIGKADATGAVTRFPVAANSQKYAGVPSAMATASDGSVWLADASQAVPRIGKVNTANGSIRFYELPETAAGMSDLVQGPDGAMWFTGAGGAYVGRLEPASGNVTMYQAPFGGLFGALTRGPDGALWFTSDSTPMVGRIDTAGNVTTYAPPGAATAVPALGGITTGPDGALWFTEPGAGKIGRLAPKTGQITEYAVKTTGSQPEGITRGPDGALWFTEAAASNIGRITRSGKVTEYPLPSTYSAPTRIIPGPGGQLWFSEPGKGVIGHFSPASPPSGAPHPAVTIGSAPSAATPFQKQCASGLLCIREVTTGGTTKIGGFRLDLPPGAIRVTGAVTDLSPGATLTPPVEGEELVSAPVNVPGGLLGTLPLIGPILGMTPAAMLPFNKLTVTQSLAGPVGLGVTDAGTLQATLPLTIHLGNDLLGPTCTIGPVTVTVAPTSLTNSSGYGGMNLNPTALPMAAKDTGAAVPAATGCGPFDSGILDPVINAIIGLPSPSGKNTFDLPLILSLGTGVAPASARSLKAGAADRPSLPFLTRPAPRPGKLLPNATTPKATGVTTKATVRP
ncbi:Vgb family protein [Actinomadura nitritigenes]|uniref:Vgb family protein n=1 Tax=Actinomadura nitritigenes TaxID=134602 RepID=UPI003D948D0A